MINNDYANREDLVQFRKQTVHGSIDDILEWKAPIRMKNILRPNCVYDSRDNEKHEHYPVTQLLIEGAPGVGKSTFAWEVCQRWGQHQLFNEYSLVVLLKFRDKRVYEAKCVSDLFYHPHPKLQSDIVHHICFMGGHGLLLIVEGFDEAPASKRTMDSIFVRLFTGQVLPKATVILTTRPSASAELRQFCNSVNSRRIEIVGFGQKEINEYIQCAFSGEQSRSDFKEYLSLYPHIHSIMYVPLNSAIVTHVYDESCKSSGAVVPKTMTQLYSSLIRTLLLRYLKDKDEYKDTCTNINTFRDLPQPVYDQFRKICKMAYTGIKSDKTELIFQDLPSDFDPLGLMQSCPELYMDRGASVSYNFLHLTVQEYLAAYHISQQSRDEHVAFMREHIENEKLEVVVRFLAGLSELGTDLWDVARGLAKPCLPFIGEQDAFVPSWKKEKFLKFQFLHCLFESQDPSVLSRTLGSDYVQFYYNDGRHPSVQTFDWFVLGYCISHSSCVWKIWLEHCQLESVEIFLRALDFQQEQCQSLTGKIKEVWLIGSHLAAVHLLVENMPQLSVFHNLTHLDLIHCGLTSETCNFLSKHNLQHLEYLDLSQNHIGRGGAVNLITSLTNTIRELNMCCTNIGFEDCKALSELLATSKYIQVLNISGKELSPESIQLILDGLSHNTSLATLDISCSNFSAENVLHLATVLEVNTRLKKLEVVDCNIQSSDSVHLAKALEENTTTQPVALAAMRLPLSIHGKGTVCLAKAMETNFTVREFDIGRNLIGSEGAAVFADMLATNKNLAKFTMDGCSIQKADAVCLAKAMKKNSTVREFDISYNPIGAEGAAAFADMLATNKSLTKLNMSRCSIQGEGAVCLAKAMKKNSTVREFDISYNPIGSEGAAAFADMLATNKSLTKLNMGWCSIHGEGAVRLAKAMEKNSTVRKFNISCNPIGSEGVTAFADMLATNKTLVKLNMIGCSIQGEGAVCLAKAMENNSTVREFDIFENPIGSEGAIALGTMLKRNRCLKQLVLMDNNIGYEDVLELIESLKHNTTLEKLWLLHICKPLSLDKTLQDRVTFW